MAENQPIQFRVELCPVGHFYPQMLLENEDVWKPIECHYCLREGHERLKLATKKYMHSEK